MDSPDQNSRYYFGVSQAQIRAAIETPIKVEHYIDYYYELTEGPLWLIRRRCLNEPGVKWTWLLEHRTTPASSVGPEPRVGVRRIRYVVDESQSIEVCAFIQSVGYGQAYTLYYAVGTSPSYVEGTEPSPNVIDAFISQCSSVYSTWPDFFPSNLRDITPSYHWTLLRQPPSDWKAQVKPIDQDALFAPMHAASK